MNDHEDHDVEKVAEDVDPVAGEPHDKYYCWTCGVGWDER